MKTYEEMAVSVFRKIDIYKEEQNKRRVAAVKTSVTISTVALLAAIGAAALRLGINVDPVPVTSQTGSTPQHGTDTSTDTPSEYSSANDASSGADRSDTPSANDPATEKTAKLGEEFCFATVHFNSSYMAGTSDGLVFELNEDGASYRVYGGQSSAEIILIPDMFEELPVTTIGQNAFSKSQNVTGVIIPDSVTSIGTGAFSNCENLTDIYYNGSDELWSFIDIAWEPAEKIHASEGLRYAYAVDDGFCGKNGYMVVGRGTCTDTDIVVPGEYNGRPVVRVCEGAFERYDDITSITFSEGIVSVHYRAVYACHKLNRILLPKSVIFVAPDAFEDCPVLHCGYAGTNEQWNKVVENSYRYIVLDYNYLPNLCTGFDGFDVKHCRPTCTESGNDLYECPVCGYRYGVDHKNEPALGHNFSDGVCTRCGISDGGDVLAESPWEYDIVLGNASVTAYTGDETAVTLPRVLEGYPVTDVNMSAADGNNGIIEKLILPDGIVSVTSVEGCTSLTQIDIPQSVKSFGVRAFKGTPIKSVAIPDGVTTVTNQMFMNCDKLASVTLPQSVTLIDKRAFESCTSLEHIDLPDSLTVLEERSFCGCTALKEIVLPEKINHVSYCCFNNCTSLSSVRFTGKINYVFSYAFGGCASLGSVDLRGTDYLDIYDHAFADCPSLTKVYLPDKVNYMSRSAFSGSENVEQIQ